MMKAYRVNHASTPDNTGIIAAPACNAARFLTHRCADETGQGLRKWDFRAVRAARFDAIADLLPDRPVTEDHAENLLREHILAPEAS